LYFFALLSSLSQAVLDDNRQPNYLDWQCVVLFTGSSIYSILHHADLKLSMLILS